MGTDRCQCADLCYNRRRRPIDTLCEICISLGHESVGPAPAPQRPAWDDYFFDMARLVVTRATCPRASIGVVLVDEHHRVIATGYNGAPANEPHCVDVGCDIFAEHCVRARHAEISALDCAWEQINTVTEWDWKGLPTGHQGKRDFLKRLAPVAYVVGPREICSHCARRLKAAGVTEVHRRES